MTSQKEGRALARGFLGVLCRHIRTIPGPRPGAIGQSLPRAQPPWRQVEGGPPGPLFGFWRSTTRDRTGALAGPCSEFGRLTAGVAGRAFEAIFLIDVVGFEGQAVELMKHADLLHEREALMVHDLPGNVAFDRR